MIIASRVLDLNLSTWRWVGSGAFYSVYVCGGYAEKLLEKGLPSNNSNSFKVKFGNISDNA